MKMNMRQVALANTTMGVLMAGLNSNVVLIALPAIFRGLNVDPMAPANSSLLLWVLMGYSVVTTVLLVTIGRASDMFGRVRTYVAGFAVFTLASALLSLLWLSGAAGALLLIALRLLQGVGASFLFSNSGAILTDVFPADRRGFALGVNQLAMIIGGMIGLVAGGFLAVLHWRLVFAISIPFGVAGTLWAKYRLPETARPSHEARFDPWGNITFGVGLTVLLVGLTYGLMPWGGAAMGWSNPLVIASVVVGCVLLLVFWRVEVRAHDPMLRLDLLRIRVFAAGNLAGWVGAIARGGQQILIVIWMQGIWLPLHGYAFEDTPLWAGIYMLPMMFGFFIGPLSGFLSDRFGARLFATGGMLVSAACFLVLARFDIDFRYPPFAATLFMLGAAMGLFQAPNTSSIMNSVPAGDRGVASGMRSTLQNSGSVLSLILFFTIIVAVLSKTVPAALFVALTDAGLNAEQARRLAALPPNLGAVRHHPRLQSDSVDPAGRRAVGPPCGGA